MARPVACAICTYQLKATRESLSQNTGTTLTLALSYGGRTELVDAVRGIAEKARDGEIDPGSISEQTISDHLYTSEMPDPDLLIRTSGEMRVSNFLLWQISYAELVVTDRLWPDFGEPEFCAAMESSPGATAGSEKFDPDQPTETSPQPMSDLILP